MSAPDSLRKHYEQKYAHEASSDGIEEVLYTSEPASRAEAALYYVCRYFDAGDILEIGSGTGALANALLTRNARINSYTLGDISLPRVEGTRRRLNDDRVRVLQLDAERVPPEMEGSFDAIIMVALIEHLVDPLGAMLKLRQLLKPRGFLYVDTPNIAKYSRRLKLLAGRFPSTASLNEGLRTYSGARVDLLDEGHLHYFTYRSLALMLKDYCGFSRTVPLCYSAGPRVFGRKGDFLIASWLPGLFSDVALVAYK